MLMKVSISPIILLLIVQEILKQVQDDGIPHPAIILSPFPFHHSRFTFDNSPFTSLITIPFHLTPPHFFTFYFYLFTLKKAFPSFESLQWM